MHKNMQTTVLLRTKGNGQEHGNFVTWGKCSVWDGHGMAAAFLYVIAMATFMAMDMTCTI